MHANPNPNVWWRTWTLEPGSGQSWEIGRISLKAYHVPGEWILSFEHGELRDGEPSAWSTSELLERPEEGEVQRFVAGRQDDRLTLRPKVADRSVVARPRVPLHVLPGEETRVYVASPVWIELLAANDQPFFEVPAVRLSDTWFGSSTRHGEVAYSLATYARSQLEVMPRRSFRAITPVVLRNESTEILSLDRLNLPVPYLSIFCTESGELWTERITLARRMDEEMALLEAGSGAPREAKGATRMGRPRLERSSGLLVRAFSSLLKPFQTED